MSISPEFAKLFSFFMKRARFSDTHLAHETGIVRQTIFRWKQPNSPFSPRRSAVIRCSLAMRLTDQECNQLLSAANLESLIMREYPESLSQEFLTQEARAQEARAQEARAQEVRDQESWAQKARDQEARTQKAREQKAREQESRTQKSRAAELLPLSPHIPETTWVSLSTFVVGMPVPVSKFIGRRYELDIIAEIWEQQPVQNIFVSGKRAVGKTSLLIYLHGVQQTSDYRRHNEDTFQRVTTVLVNFQDVRMQVESSVLAHILNTLNFPLPEGGVKSVDLFGFMDSMDQLSSPVIILLDGVETGIRAPGLTVAFWNTLRSLSQQTNYNKVNFVVTSCYSPLELIAMSEKTDKSSPFFNTFGHIIYLERWTREDSINCINLSSKPFSNDDVQWILEHGDDWPILVQLLCDLCHRAQRHREMKESWREMALRRLALYPHLLDKDK